MTRGNKEQSKVIYKGRTQDFVIMVENTATAIQCKSTRKNQVLIEFAIYLDMELEEFIMKQAGPQLRPSSAHPMITKPS